MSEPTTEISSEPAAESAPDWMSRMSDLGEAEEEPLTEQPASNDLDWFGGMDTPETSEPAASSGLDWLGSPSSLNLAPEETLPVRPSGSQLDWLGRIGSSDASEPETALPADDGGVDWLSKMGELPPIEAESQPQSEPAAESAPDWMSSLSGFGLGSQEPVSEQPAEEDPDWLQGVESFTAPEPASAIPSAPASESGFDWLSDLGDVPTPEVTSESAPTAVSDLDWMSSMDALSQDNLASETAGSDLNWMDSAEESAQPELANKNVEPEASLVDALQELAQQPPPEQTPHDEDPLAWMRQYNISMPSVQSHLSEPEQAVNVPLEAADLGNLLQNLPSVPATMSKEPLNEQSMVDEWAAAFEPEAESVAPASPVAETDEGSWFDSMATPEETVSPPPTTDWLSSLGSTPAAEVPQEVEADADLPDWMREMGSIPEPTTPMDMGSHEPQSTQQPQESATEGHFTALLKAAAQKANEPQPTGDTGVLDSAQVPDWMSAFADDTTATTAPAVGEQEPDDWGAAIASEDKSPESEPVGAPASIGFSDDLFADLSDGSISDSSTNDELADDQFVMDDEEIASAEVPGWLAAMAPAQKTENQVPAEPLPVENLDFSVLESNFADMGNDFPDFDSSEPDFVKMLDSEESALPASPVAQSPSLGNTTLDTRPTPAEGGASFKFNRKPAWMRDKKSSAGGESAASKPSKNAAVADADDEPDWLRE